MVVLLLHVHNDDFGEPITIGTQVASGTRTSLGTLAPSECVSVPVQTISGVYASCALEAAIDSRPAVIDEPGKARGGEGATAQLQRPQQNNSNENHLQTHSLPRKRKSNK